MEMAENQFKRLESLMLNLSQRMEESFQATWSRINELELQLRELKIKLEQKDDPKIEEKPIESAMVIQKDDPKNEEQQSAMLKQIEKQLRLANLKIKKNEEKLIKGQSRIEVYNKQVLDLQAANTILQSKLTSNEEELLRMEKELSRSIGVSEALELDIEKKARSARDLRKENVTMEDSMYDLCDECSRLERMENKLKEQLVTIQNEVDTLKSSARALEAERKLKPTGSKV